MPLYLEHGTPSRARFTGRNLCRKVYQDSLLAFVDDGVILVRRSDGKVMWNAKISYKNSPSAVSMMTLDVQENQLNALVLGYSGPDSAISSNVSAELTVVYLQLALREPQQSVAGPVETFATEYLKNGPQDGAASVYQLSAGGQLEEHYHLNKTTLCAKANLNGEDYLFTAFQEMNKPWENFAVAIYHLDSGEPVSSLTPGPWTIATHHGAVEWVS
ncbi:unnamed protein product [Echinostoma caproni]|uniref:Bulb-type lectin domain-containing protein n=1 Tax=Echinostoma caproni TaxID=27848 RepID=A0A183ALL8_9TREM|nr:unnamed protein product [Echinostoma caproni]